MLRSRRHGGGGAQKWRTRGREGFDLKEVARTQQGGGRWTEPAGARQPKGKAGLEGGSEAPCAR